MANFLSGLEEASTKKKYQSYLVEMGIEKVTVLIPLELAESFEREVAEAQPRGSRGLSVYVEKFNGILGG
jgi:hypothetical protein